MERIIIFSIVSIILTAISWRTIFDPKSHGFYRYMSWLCIAWLVSNNYSYWVYQPFSIRQIISYLCLIPSLYLAVAGFILMAKEGKPKKERNEKKLYPFEKTTELVDKGIFKYIRHPLYSSLIFLTWGTFLKNPEIKPELLLIAATSTILLYLTAHFDEKECIVFFGDKYIEYMNRSKRFIPYVI